MQIQLEDLKYRRKAIQANITDLTPRQIGENKKHTEHFFICLEFALDTTKKWNLKHHLGDKLKAF